MKKTLPEDGVDVTHMVGIMDLKGHHCRWPVYGEGAGMKYCGARRQDAGIPIDISRPYCEEHNGHALWQK